MERVFVLLLAASLFAGCQVQNPLALGPPRVPSPSTSQSAPYYPPTAGLPKTPASAPPASQRISVSAEDGPPLAKAPPRIVTDSSDREPIRIVENPTPTRTASSANRGQTPVTPAPQPSGTPAKSPGNKATSPQLNYMPPSQIPSSFRSDSAVAPASYQQPSSAFSEPRPASGQWRTR